MSRANRCLRVVLIEDDVINMELLQAVLEGGGFDVLTATDAPSGIDLALREQPDHGLVGLGVGQEGLAALAPDGQGGQRPRVGDRIADGENADDVRGLQIKTALDRQLLVSVDVGFETLRRLGRRLVQPVFLVRQKQVIQKACQVDPRHSVRF